MEIILITLLIIAICGGFVTIGFILGRYDFSQEEPTDDAHQLPNCTCDDSTTCDIYCIAKHKFNQDHGFN